MLLKNFSQGTVGQQLGMANGTSLIYASLGVSEDVWKAATVSSDGWMVTLLQRPATVGVRPLISEERIAAS